MRGLALLIGLLSGTGMAWGPTLGRVTPSRVYFVPTPSGSSCPYVAPPMGKTGHVYDCNTIALWRLDSVPEGPTGISPEVGLKYPLTNEQGPSYDIDFTASGQINGAAYRAGEILLDGAYVLVGATDAAARTALSGEFTVEFWMKSIDLERRGIVSMGDNTGGEWGFRIEMSAGGGIALNYKATSGEQPVSSTDDNYEADQYGSPWKNQAGAWVHVAVRRRLAAGRWYVDFFTDGVYRNTVLQSAQENLKTPKTLVDATDAWRLGGANWANYISWRGSLDDVRVSKVARSASEILESYQRGFVAGGVPLTGNGTGHVNDASALALWRLDEASATSNAADSSASEFTLPVVQAQAPPTGSSLYPAPQTGRIGGAREPVDTNGFFIAGGAGASSLASAMATGNYSIEAWVWWNGYYEGPLFKVWREDGWNLGAIFGHTWLSYQGLSMLWSSAYDSGGPTLTKVTLSGVFTLPQNQWFHLAVVYRNVGGQQYIDRYLNGGSKSTVGPYAIFSDVGRSPAGSINVGLGYNHLNADGPIGAVPYEGWQSFGGYIDDFRFSNVSRTADDVYMSYQRGMGITLNTNLAAYYPLETNANDSLGAHNGTASSVTFQGAYSTFTGDIASRVELSGVDLGTAWTLCAWTYLTADSRSFIIKSVDPTPGVQLNWAMTPSTYEWTQALQYSNPWYNPDYVGAGANVWRFLCVVKNGAAAQTYYEAAIARANFPGGDLTGTIQMRPQYIGSNTVDFGFSGHMKHLGMWSRALSPAEIALLYNAGTPLGYPF